MSYQLAVGSTALLTTRIVASLVNTVTNSEPHGPPRACEPER